MKMSEQAKDLGVGALYLAFVIVTGNVLLQIATISALWNWFVVPLGMDHMSWTLAFGVTLLVNVVGYRWTPTTKYTRWQILEGALAKTSVCAVSLGVGWAVATWGLR